MKYFATIALQGIVIRAAETIEEFARPEEWKEVPDIQAHTNDIGLRKLNAGSRIVFTSSDLSYPSLMSLFHQE